jgi:hypothetical protein
MAATNLPTSGRLPSRTTKFGVGRAMAPTVAALSVGACVPTLAKSLRSARTSDRNPSLDRRAQQRDFTPRLMITPLLVGGFPDTISPRLSGSLMAARVLALSMARSAMRATGGTLPSRPDLITDDGTHRQCVRVQTFSRVGQTVQAGHFSRKPVGLPNWPHRRCGAPRDGPDRCVSLTASGSNRHGGIT